MKIKSKTSPIIKISPIINSLIMLSFCAKTIFTFLRMSKIEYAKKERIKGKEGIIMMILLINMTEVTRGGKWTIRGGV